MAKTQCSVCVQSLQLIVVVLILIAATGWPNPSARYQVSASKESETVAQWAKVFGEELLELGEKMTKSVEIKKKYTSYNARVENKGNETLIKSIVANVGRMLQRKIDAVRCIMQMAEKSSDQFELNNKINPNYTYYSSKHSPINDTTDTADIKTAIEYRYKVIEPENPGNYTPFWLYQDTHFYNIHVNTSISSVHVPTNVYDKLPAVQKALQWSQALDNVFVQNYQSDPALSWQYFGSDTGIMRHFPAKMWESKGVDVYDCRKRSWYIETATCSKDIVILLDNSGSMTGFRNYIAQLTVKSILDTFSNNDFINIYNYSTTISCVVPCFNKTLVQATPENILVFNQAVRALKPEGYANITNAFAGAFELLARYRELRRCNESMSGCNQAIMLITDGVLGNLTDTFLKYNAVDNGNFTRMPVRIFTYVLGKEVTKVPEIQQIACHNRGHYSHIKTLDVVQREVLKYVKVIASPLVLQAVDHPPTWTHAFKDEAHVDESSTVRLMIAVGVPAFGRVSNEFGNGTVRSSQLLGVAATDVPVEDIDKLSLPYMLGVNGYSFIVSNNGYVMLHPDLRPLENGILKNNYNSIDLTEVEQFDDNVAGRDPGQELLQLRRNLIENKEGKLENIPVKFHFDKMRRVSQEKFDYYYAPLPNTPFSMGLAIPSGYGNTWIKVGDEVSRNVHMNVNMSDFFLGDNWKVHPEWVYCKYHYLEGHEYPSPEMELRHFLTKLSDKSWKWSEQYEVDHQHQEEANNEPNCGRKTMDISAYYCNKELVQLLIFDAKVTNTSYRTWEFESEEVKKLIEKYNATLRFVATMSGLTRWQFIFGEVEDESDVEFGDFHNKAVDETWYKTAILQHQIDPKSFVFSVPHANDPKEPGELKITATHAIFPRDGGKDAPSSVVGFQFSHANMYKRFMDITSSGGCEGCLKPCSDEMQDCYVIDNNGYVILSEYNDTGKYFGELDKRGVYMQSMIQMGIFKNLTVYDFQALCSEQIEIKSDAQMLMTPFRMLNLGVNWLVYELFTYLCRIHLWVQGIPSYIDNECDGECSTPSPTAYGSVKVQNDEKKAKKLQKKYETVYRPCDKQTNLTILQQRRFIQGNEGGLPSHGTPEGAGPYYFKRIPYSNLLLVVVDTSREVTNLVRVSAAPTEMKYKEEFPCYKNPLNNMLRRRLDECFTEHPDEAMFTDCGEAHRITLCVYLIISTVLLIVIRLVN